MTDIAYTGPKEGRVILIAILSNMSKTTLILR